MADDRIIIPIEVETTESSEVRKMIQDLKSVEGPRKSKLPKTIKSGGAPNDINFGGTEENRGGIFGGARDIKTNTPRNRTSKQSIHVENRFKNLETKQDRIEKSLGLLGQGLGDIRNPIQAVTGLLNKIPYVGAVIGVVLMAKGLGDYILEQLFKPGGLFDRRYLRKFEGIISNLTSRREKAEINAGIRDIRVTTRSGLRGGRGQFVTTTQFANRGGFYDRELEQMAKGVI